MHSRNANVNQWWSKRDSEKEWKIKSTNIDHGKKRAHFNEISKSQQEQNRESADTIYDSQSQSLKFNLNSLFVR